ncbi:hypothetical protein [Chitinophaga sp. OAE865]|uniref:hypothetical protein n=1 Tax=Chitinophaga sp. OAE865 TaxID=2817898 RepID=UPI001AE92543
MRNYVPLLILLLTPLFIHVRQTFNGLTLPESAVAYNGGYFVSGIGAKLAPVKDGDGVISHIGSDGKLVLKYFEDTLHAPSGLQLMNNILYVADLDHLKGYDVVTKKKVFDLNLEGKEGMLNDVCRVNDSLLLTTDSFKGHVLMVNIFTGTYTVLKGNMAAPNGVCYDAAADKVYVCAMGPNYDGAGKVYAKKLHDGNAAFEPLEGAPVGLLDGMILLDDHRLLISDWITLSNPTAGKLHVYDLNKKQYTTINTQRAPADIALDAKQQVLLMPQMLDNLLRIIPLKEYGL